MTRDRCQELPTREKGVKQEWRRVMQRDMGVVHTLAHKFRPVSVAFLKACVSQFVCVNFAFKCKTQPAEVRPTKLYVKYIHQAFL